MHRRHHSRWFPSLFALLASLTLTSQPRVVATARAATPEDGASEARTIEESAESRLAVRKAKRDLILQGARNRIASTRTQLQWERWKKKHPGAGKRGLKARPANDAKEEGALPLDDRGLASRTGRASVTSTLAVPINVRCNNPTGELAGTGQAEESIASFGSFVLVAWNDGNGFNTGGDIQNYAYSTNGGTTFIQPAGGIPHPAGASGFRWRSDPLVTVNEKTGEFFFAALCDTAGIAFSGVGTAKATFPGGVSPPVWGAAHVTRRVDATVAAIDKEWMVADSSSGNLYMSYTMFFVDTFNQLTDSIVVQRSTDSGVTWGPAITVSEDSTAGYVQGSRTAVGAKGEVYVVWEQIGIATLTDHFMLKKSTDHGQTFGPLRQVDEHYSNFGTGAPGFNRQSGITFPGITVDRTFSPNRGRIYVTWNESVNWYNDPLGGGGSLSESESNNTVATADPFLIGQILRGGIANNTDADYFSFSATQGSTYIFWCDSLNTNLQYTMRVLCNDAPLTRLSLSGADVNSPGSQGFLVWTAPTTATYLFRMAYNGSLGGYRVRTGVNGANTGERSRDHRDVFVSYSNDAINWSTPTRPNDDLARYDDWLPEVGVGGDGMPYVLWFDWRDASTNCYGNSNIYLTRSTDGGATWAANVPITSAPSTWPVTASNIAPNQGDYNALFGQGRFMHPSWADDRGSDVDVWSTAFDTGFDITTCKNDSTITTGTTLTMTFSWANRNVVFPNDYTYNLTDDGAWASAVAASATVAAGGSQSVTYNVAVPGFASTSNTFRFTVKNSKGTLIQTCVVHMTVTGNTDTTPTSYTFALRPAVPNPSVNSARIDFTLPRTGAVKLVIYGLHGEHVRTLVDGVKGAGLNTATWDGRDDHGHRVHAGAYFYRLEGFGQNQTNRLVLLP